MNKPVLYIVQGFLGSGKTTFSKKLAVETGAIRLNADEWVMENCSESEFENNWDACFGKAVSQLWSDTAHFLEIKRNVILDMGFWNRQSRDYARERASALQADLVHYYLYAPDDVLLERIGRRSGSIAVRNLANFQSMKAHFHEPDADEKAIYVANYDRVRA